MLDPQYEQLRAAALEAAERSGTDPYPMLQAISRTAMARRKVEAMERAFGGVTVDSLVSASKVLDLIDAYRAYTNALQDEHDLAGRFIVQQLQHVKAVLKNLPFMNRDHP